MTGRGVVWGAGVLMVLAAVTGGLTNELHGGWPWWVAAAVVTVGSAGLTMWLASATAVGAPVRVEDGGVYAGRDLRGRTRTRVRGPGTVPAVPPAAGWLIGRGAVGAGRDIISEVSTDVDTGDTVPPPGPAGPPPGLRR